MLSVNKVFRICVGLSTGVRISITAKNEENLKSLRILSIRFDKNDRNGNLGNPARVTINSPSIHPYSVIIMTRCATAFYPLA